MHRRFAVAWLVIAVAIAVLATLIATSVPAKYGRAETAPFRWQGIIWCPTYRGSVGCDDIQQRGILSSAGFYPSQVIASSSSGYILLKMNLDSSRTGAFNTQTHETWRPPARISEQINLPCNAAGRIENWPAFWLVSTGSWPASDEIDVMEGLNGSAAWHYHYLNKFGEQRSAGGVVSGFSACGIHTYAVNWTRAAIAFYYDGTEVGNVTSREIGVPIASDPMYIINDYASSSIYGGPTKGNVNMEILEFSS